MNIFHMHRGACRPQRIRAPCVHLLRGTRVLLLCPPRPTVALSITQRALASPSELLVSPSEL
jgi:hypothetical protein